MGRANKTFLAGNRSGSKGRPLPMLGTEKGIEAGMSAGAIMRFGGLAAVWTVGLLMAVVQLGGHAALAQQAGEQAEQQAEQRGDQANGPREAVVVAQAGSPLNARRSVIEGIKSFEARKYADAVTSLSIAMQGEGLTAKDTAKALFYRGRAYKQLKKFPEAIADLTSAMWLKDGLSDAERQQAEADRKASYAGVGVASPATVARSKTAAPATTSAPAAPATPLAAAAPATPMAAAPAREIAVPVKPVEVARPARQTAAAPVPSASASTNWTTSVGTNGAASPGSAQQAPTRTAALPGGGRAGSYSPDTNSDGMVGFPAGTAVTGGASPSTAVPATSPPSPASPSGNPFQQVGQQVGSFFSNMTNAITGGGSASSGSTAKPVPDSTASTGGTPTGAVTAVSAWNSGTEVAPASSAASAAPARPAAEPVRKTAALAPANVAPAAAPRPASSGKAAKYRLQLAAVRSRNEAERLARDLASQYRSALGSYSPEINETVYGNMGTFYRVQIGPFASVTEPQSLCTKIKSSGFDCLITGQ